MSQKMEFLLMSSVLRRLRTVPTPIVNRAVNAFAGATTNKLTLGESRVVAGLSRPGLARMLLRCRDEDLGCGEPTAPKGRSFEGARRRAGNLPM